MEAIVFLEQNLKVTYPYLCHVLLIAQTSHGIMEEVYEYQEIEITGGQLRGWLPQERSRIDGRDIINSESFR